MTAQPGEVLPHDLATERALLGAMLLADEAILAALDAGVSPTSFYKPGHGHVADVILGLRDGGEPVDAVTVAEALQSRGLMGDVGDRAVLLDYESECPAITNAGAYAAKLRHLQQCRAWVHLGSELQRGAQNKQLPSDAALATIDGLRNEHVDDGDDGATFVDWRVFWTQDWAASDWVLEPLLPRGRATHIFARRGTGKSEFMLFCAAALATGRVALSRAASEPVPVIYLDAEMGEVDLHERLLNLGYGPGDDLGNLHYAVMPTLPPLNSEAGGARLLRWCRDVDAQIVVADSLQGLVDGEENSNDLYDDLGRWTLAPLRREGITSCWTGNTGKDPTKGSRGGSRKEDLMDLVWDLQRTDGGARLTNTKKRISWAPDVVNLSRDERDGILSFKASSGSYPVGTTDVANRLDALDAPLDVTVRAANQLLKDAGGAGAKTEVVTAAVRLRREQLGRR